MDTGLDKTSCFFADDAGGEVEHGYVFDGIEVDATSGYPSAALGQPWFPYDMSRRKVRCRVFKQLISGQVLLGQGNDGPTSPDN